MFIFLENSICQPVSHHLALKMNNSVYVFWEHSEGKMRRAPWLWHMVPGSSLLGSSCSSFQYVGRRNQLPWVGKPKCKDFFFLIFKFFIGREILWAWISKEEIFPGKRKESLRWHWNWVLTEVNYRASEGRRNGSTVQRVGLLPWDGNGSAREKKAVVRPRAQWLDRSAKYKKLLVLSQINQINPFTQGHAKISALLWQGKMNLSEN